MIAKMNASLAAILTTFGMVACDRSSQHEQGVLTVSVLDAAAAWRQIAALDKELEAEYRQVAPMVPGRFVSVVIASFTGGEQKQLTCYGVASPHTEQESMLALRLPAAFRNGKRIFSFTDWKRKTEVAFWQPVAPIAQIDRKRGERGILLFEPCRSEGGESTLVSRWNVERDTAIVTVRWPLADPTILIYPQPIEAVGRAEGKPSPRWSCWVTGYSKDGVVTARAYMEEPASGGVAVTGIPEWLTVRVLPQGIPHGP